MFAVKQVKQQRKRSKSPEKNPGEKDEYKTPGAKPCGLKVSVNKTDDTAKKDQNGDTPPSNN